MEDVGEIMDLIRHQRTTLEILHTELAELRGKEAQRRQAALPTTGEQLYARAVAACVESPAPPTVDTYIAKTAQRVGEYRDESDEEENILLRISRPPDELYWHGKLYVSTSTGWEEKKTGSTYNC